MKTSTIAFDVNLGCSAYPYGLHLLGSMISKGGIEKALLLVGDKSASYNDLLFQMPQLLLHWNILNSHRQHFLTCIVMGRVMKQLF